MSLVRSGTLIAEGILNDRTVTQHPASGLDHHRTSASVCNLCTARGTRRGCEAWQELVPWCGCDTESADIEKSDCTVSACDNMKIWSGGTSLVVDPAKRQSS